MNPGESLGRLISLNRSAEVFFQPVDGGFCLLTTFEGGLAEGKPGGEIVGVCRFGFLGYVQGFVPAAAHCVGSCEQSPGFAADGIRMNSLAGPAFGSWLVGLRSHIVHGEG